MNVVCNPTGLVEPAYLGVMWFDHVNNVFYQARGPTKDDWWFVRPEDFVGSMVKVYDQFYGVPEDDPKDDGAAQRYADAKLVRDTMALSGVDVLGLGGLRWRAASGIDVLQVRIAFRKVTGFRMFIGFADDPRAYRMPKGVGFEVDAAGFVRFNGNARELTPGETVVLRIEAAAPAGRRVTAFVNEQALDEAGVPYLPPTPVAALLDVAPGPRPFAPGYEHAVKRNVDRRAAP